LFYAKTKPVQTIRNHTDCLVTELERLKSTYGSRFVHMDERMWELLRLAVEYHDVGKAWPGFQNRLRKQLGEKEFPNTITYSVPHNYLSVGMLPIKKYKLTKEESRLLIHAVGYHHERSELPDKEKIEEVLENEMRPYLTELIDHMKLDIPEKFSYKSVARLSKRYSQLDDEFYKYVLLKGLVHRIDHAASAGVDIELHADKHIGAQVTAYMKRKGYAKNELQQFAEANTDKNIIVIAQTGMGKTEAALLWINEDKGFFTLPLRVSINAIYDRILSPQEINYHPEALGLLHSTSHDYLQEKEEQDEKWEDIYRHSRHLSSKLLLTTIDQILKFPFGYRGFEKELAAMANAKVVIDEIQAYEPKIAAMLIKALEMIHKIGGKFMVMTATLPTIYLDELKKRNIIAESDVGEFINQDITRHRVCLRQQGITEAAQEIIEQAKDAQVLVIVNTVRRAVEMYEQLREVDSEANVYLLHSQFTREDRQLLEEEIKAFNKPKPGEPRRIGIWVTTQLVEASLDIDFDYLYTEISTLDSFFQRLGRCYRNGKRSPVQPNVYVFTEDVAGLGYIYDADLVQKGLALLQPYQGRILDEQAKVEMVRHLYSRESLANTAFLRGFEEALHEFDYLDFYEVTGQEAQKKLRDIQTVQVIPESFFDEIFDLVKEYEKCKVDWKRRREIRRKIEAKSIGIYRFQAKGKLSTLSGLDDISILHCAYEFDRESKQGRGIVSDIEITMFS
jgi:CRISPR-associated endonuclease/helicase Cas3